MTYLIKNQLQGITRQVHAEQIRVAPVDWPDEPQKNDSERPLRGAKLVVPPENSGESETDSGSEEQQKVDKRSPKLEPKRSSGSSSDSESNDNEAMEVDITPESCNSAMSYQDTLAKPGQVVPTQTEKRAFSSTNNSDGDSSSDNIPLSHLAKKRRINKLKGKTNDIKSKHKELVDIITRMAGLL